MEAQKVRSVKRYLDYEQRLRAGQGLDELYQWVVKILCDDGEVYGLVDKALAFEIGAREGIARVWPDDGVASAAIAVAGPVDRTFLYRQLLAPENGPERRAAFAGILHRQYRRQWAWMRDRLDRAEAPVAADIAPAFQQFLNHLNDLDPLDLGAAGGGRQLAELRAELEQRSADAERLREYLEAARDRSEAAHERARELEDEARGLRRSLQQEEEARDKLRAERTRRIKAEREAADLGRQLDRVRGEYVKLDQRLRQMAGRLASAGEGRGAVVLNLGELKNLGPEHVLGVGPGVGEGELGQVRRRFAAAFHSDRAGQLPGWVRELFDQVLSVVNSACDRLGH